MNKMYLFKIYLYIRDREGKIGIYLKYIIHISLIFMKLPVSSDQIFTNIQIELNYYCRIIRYRIVFA